MEGYIPKEKRKKIMFLCDDIRTVSGIATMAREIVIGTAHHFNWVNVGGVMQHPEEGKRLDLSADTNKNTGIDDSDIILYPVSGYGTPELIRHLLDIEKPDAIMIFTDPRYWVWLFQIEHEVRKKVPIIYLNIWDDLPYPMYNKSFYESCDGLLAISKQTENINRVVLGDIASEKVIKYVPHGINDKQFYPIEDSSPEYLALQEFKSKLFSGKEYDFTILFNARNIRRKQVADLLLAYKMFIDGLPANSPEKIALVLHTQPIDENGTDLFAVCDMLFGNNDKYNIIFSENRLAVDEMRLLYNSCDLTTLISANEGWGLSLTEAMMCGKPIMANVTGGMQDQMRFQDENGKWITFTEEFGSNHRGKYKECGEWAYPIFPNNISLLGSPATPYIYDDRCSPEQVAATLDQAFRDKIRRPERWESKCQSAREWVTSDESMMSSKWMTKNVIDGINETIDKFEPRYKFELIQVDPLEQPRHYTKYPVAQ